jgi:RHS repeat-associated protein
MRTLLARLLPFALLLGIGSAGAATLSVSPTSVSVTGSVTATWSGIATPSGTDWIGLYTPGAPNTSYLSYRYTTGTASGSVPFTIPAHIAPGTYQLRLLANNGYTVLATSENFTVTAVNITLTETPASVLPGASVTAAWSGVPTPAASDWIGLFTPGASNSAYSAWRYTTGAASGSVPFAIPAGSAPGTYQLRIFVNNGYSATSNNFSVSAKLSGTVTLSGAPLSGVGFAPTNGGTCEPSNAVGQYSCSVPPGWSGSITPSLSGYAFTPASRSYSNVTAAQAGQNFTATPTYELSGTVTAGGSALSDVAFAATNGATCTSSNASGQYSCTVPHGWSGTVTASRAGYAFTPASRTYSAVAGALAAQDYAASVTYQLSGTVTQGGSPLPGVVFLATDGGNCTTSNASGQYTCTVPQGWSGSVTAWLDAYIFSPDSRNYANVTANQTAQDYASTAVHKLSGTISMNGVPLSNVTLAAPGGVCTSSNASGQYSCNVPPGWSGSVTPSANGYTFTPPSRSYSNVASSQTAQDFSGTLVSATAPMFFVHADHLNTPRLVANAAGTTVWRWDQQEPFGVNVPDENPSGLGLFEFPLRFPGQYADKETNLHYNYFRDYDPSIGRYGKSDPIGLEGGLNTYAYVAGSPLSFADPDGLEVRFFCRELAGGAALGSRLFYDRTQKHCFVQVKCPQEGIDVILSLFGVGNFIPNQGQKNLSRPNDKNLRDNPASPANTDNHEIVPNNPDCRTCCRYEKEVLAKFNNFPSGLVNYEAMGWNSNSFAEELVTSPICRARLPYNLIQDTPGLGVPR